MLTIPHISKEKLHLYGKLIQKKYREQEGKFLIEGVHLVQEALSAGWQIEAILITSDLFEKERTNNWFGLIHKQQIALFEVSEIELRKLSDVVTSQGVIAIASSRKHQNSFSANNENTANNNIVVALDRINDPGNLGTIIRTCDWFGVKEIVISEGSAELYSPKVVRATMGSLFHLLIFSGIELSGALQQYKNLGYSIVASTLKSKQSLSDVSFNRNTVIVLGSESHGIGPEIISMADELVTIPKYGKAESLNVAIACGIILSHIK